MTKTLYEQMADELRELMDSPMGGLRPGSNTNKTRCAMLALLEKAYNTTPPVKEYEVGEKVVFNENICTVDTWEPYTQTLFIVNDETGKSVWVATSAVTPYIPEIYDGGHLGMEKPHGESKDESEDKEEEMQPLSPEERKRLLNDPWTVKPNPQEEEGLSNEDALLLTTALGGLVLGLQWLIKQLKTKYPNLN